MAEWYAWLSASDWWAPAIGSAVLVGSVLGIGIAAIRAIVVRFA